MLNDLLEQALVQPTISDREAYRMGLPFAQDWNRQARLANLQMNFTNNPAQLLAMDGKASLWKMTLTPRCPAQPTAAWRSWNCL